MNNDGRSNYKKLLDNLAVETHPLASSVEEVDWIGGTNGLNINGLPPAICQINHVIATFSLYFETNCYISTSNRYFLIFLRNNK